MEGYVVFRFRDDDDDDDDGSTPSITRPTPTSVSRRCVPTSVRCTCVRSTASSGVPVTGLVSLPASDGSVTGDVTSGT